ncbi:hypothetical protein [Eisenbergiella porci]|uniref:hypothetical protein n=1 Tax=Eisenbergiella porci TaxID=2652274 RepID=UPI002A90E5F7|nr:hypothetical protein [Eisenbergiella porci]MDY5525325.1 hypothetical protein [Eisenbergiella porci]
MQLILLQSKKYIKSISRQCSVVFTGCCLFIGIKAKKEITLRFVDPFQMGLPGRRPPGRGKGIDFYRKKEIDFHYLMRCKHYDTINRNKFCSFTIRSYPA